MDANEKVKSKKEKVGISQCLRRRKNGKTGNVIHGAMGGFAA